MNEDVKDYYHLVGILSGRVWAKNHPGRSMERANQDSMLFADFLNVPAGPDREVIRGFMDAVIVTFYTQKKESN